MAIDRRLNAIAIPAEARQQVNADRIKLAAMQIPSGINEEMRTALRQTINECFVFGFRRVMLVGTALALASSLASALIIRRQ